MSYAEAAAKVKKDGKCEVPKATLKRWMKPATSGDGKPKIAEAFGKCHIRLNVDQKSKILPRGVMYAGIRRLLRILDIQAQVKEMSLIGRSVVELYYKTEDESKIKETLRQKEVLIDKFDVMAISQMTKKTSEEIAGHLVSRIVNLLTRNRGTKFREAIFLGITEDIQIKCLQKEAENGLVLKNKNRIVDEAEHPELQHKDSLNNDKDLVTDTRC